MIISHQEIVKLTYEGQRAYGRDRGPCKAGIGRGGDLAHVIQPTKNISDCSVDLWKRQPSSSCCKSFCSRALIGSSTSLVRKKFSDISPLFSIMRTESGDDG